MIGQSISHYRILRRLGAGGMGEVFEAEDTDLHRKVALKILPQEMASKPETLDRFKREARALAALNHPNIVTIYSVEQSGTTHFLSMELVEGRPLSELIPQGGFTVEKLFALGIPLTDALAAAHAGGIGHRDLKPSNVMVNDQGRVKVIDFGLAKLFQSEAAALDVEAPTVHQTVEGKILGTPAYMSPEQIEGRKVDHRTDIFSLGILLCEMATAQRPFKGDSAMSIMSSILRDTPPPLSELKPGLPEHLGRIVRRCLQKNPDERYQSLLDVRNELKGLEEETRITPSAALTVPIDSQHRVKDQATPERIEPTFAPPGSSHSHRPGQRWSLALMAVLLFTLAGTALYWFKFRPGTNSLSQKSGAPDRTGPPALEKTRIIVLPLASRGKEDEEVGFAGGMTDALRGHLSKIAGLRVIDGTLLANVQGDLPELARKCRELNAGSLLRGAVQQIGGHLRVHLELLDSQTAEVLWPYDETPEFKDIFAMQNEVAQGVATAVQVQLLPGEKQQLARNSTDNPEAFKLYLRGRERWNLFTGEGWKQAIRFYEEAIKKDTNYALAYAGIADCYTLLSIGAMHPTNAFPLAMRHAQQAVRLDNSLAEAHVSLGMCRLFYELNWEEAKRELERAVALKPNYADARHYYAHYLEAMGRLDEAVAQWQLAVDLDPLSLIIRAELGWCYYFKEDWARSIEECQKALAMDRSFGIAWQGLAMAYGNSGRYSEAIESIKAITAWDDSPELMSELGYSYARSGKTNEAREVIGNLEERKARGTYVDSYFLAYIHAGLDEKTQATARLKEAFDQRSTMMSWIRVEPKFKPLRTEQGFRDLLQKMNFKL